MGSGLGLGRKLRYVFVAVRQLGGHSMGWLQAVGI